MIPTASAKEIEKPKETAPPAKKKTVPPAPVKEPKKEVPQQVKTAKGLNLDKLAHAVSRAETGGCKLGYGKEYNNCFGIKSGKTAPCPKVGRNKMCIYQRKEDSFIAFKKIWSTWYKTFPNITLAERWTGKDNARTWLKHVTHYYES